VDRNGKEEPIAAEANSYMYPRISPDGTRLALTVWAGREADIWIWDLARETMTRLTFVPGEDSWPIWTPDSKRIVYRSSRGGGGFDVNVKAADGTGEIEKLFSFPDYPGPFSWAKDGKTLLSWDLTSSPLQTDISMFSVEGDHARVPLLHATYNEDHPQISPDGQWMAYASNESGRNEVYVRPFPEVNKGQLRVSIGGGYGPLWSPDGRELFYRNGESVLAVSVKTNPSFQYGKPKVLFQGIYFYEFVGQAALPYWDISPDGKRFLMLKPYADTSPAAGGPRKINIVLNWLEELKQHVPVK
jgi:serine/threonine-protein kinase